MKTLRDYRPVELLVAALVALPIPFVGAYALAVSSVGSLAELPAIDRGAALPIRVKPVLDLESPNVKLGGGKAQVKMPQAWADPPAPPPAAGEARVSMSAKDDPAAIPPKELPMAAATAPDPPVDAPPATPTSEVSSAPASSGEGSTTVVSPTTGGGATDGVEGVPGVPPGPGSPDGSPDGTPDADPRKRNAARRYLGRVVSFFTARFRAPCLTLTPEERQKFRAVASVVLGPDGTVVSYALVRSGHPDLDAAAESAMQSARGQQIPPPPEDFPELRPSSTNVTFVCGS
ncbi:MAG: TonB C-terminal domain-containing protein [Deltaproteobacteria bacterium]|nr:TonB C-terminal domain-containing protein [Deltaproteobacteria bacterium]